MEGEPVYIPFRKRIENALGTRRRHPAAYPCPSPLETLPIHPAVVVVMHDLPSELAGHGFLRRLPLSDRPTLGHAVESWFDESRRLGKGREAARAPKDDIAALGEGGEGGLIEGSGLGEGCESGLLESARLRKGRERGRCEGPALGQRREGTLAPDRNRS